MVEFESGFKDNGNSFQSCFQFEGREPHGHLHVRVKYYSKFLALVQSETVQKNVGMNMRAIFYPTARMNNIQRESKGECHSRIEITYTASDQAGEDEMLGEFFLVRVNYDLNKAEKALRKVASLGWHIPVDELFECFCE